MSDDPKSIKALRRYYRNSPATGAEREAFIAEVGGESDRAAIILLASTLSDTLAIVLEANMVGFENDQERDRLFSGDGVLANFSSRIEVAYQFGLIDERARESLHVIRDMRNAAAHSERPITFATPEIKAVCKRVFEPRGHRSPRSDEPADLKSGFISESLFLYQVIIYGRETAVERMDGGVRAWERKKRREARKKKPSA